MAQQFTTAPNLSNLYSTHTLNNTNLVKTINSEQKDWIKKYHKIIWGIEQMVDIQLQLQNIIKLAEETNAQIAEIKSTILQASNNYWTQTAGNIFSISKDLQNIIQSNMENQAYHIQKLLVDELDNCKEKENKYAKGHIKEIQDTYKQEDIEIKTQESSKGKQQIQDKEVLLYKSYEVKLSKPRILELKSIQDEINNLERYMKFMQSPVQTMSFHPLSHYKNLQP